MDLDAVTDELYAVPPGAFVPARNARAKELAAAGEREAAAAVRTLPRPSAAAWLVNRLVRDHGADVDRLLALRTAFEKAQGGGDRDRLRALSTRRQALVAGLVEHAGALARDAGHPLSAAVQRELEGTLEAAVADEDAAGAVRSGRLAAALSHVGFPGVAAVPARPRRGGAAATRADRSATASARARQARDKAEAARRRAEAEVTALRRARRAAEQEQRRAASELRRADRALERSSTALAEAEAAHREVVDELRHLGDG
ncbi:MAG TPA: hypothetical protein VLZ77_12095 [Acidimicrobiales bacterium]|nr:hypothetical protein [Acidimicrobiales bacterium]